ncbi:MAG: PAS domain S-box protein [Candidatus Eisenbacteria bacterium]|nr:PAS domain S-box protein [Candidatus Eisenbacteria bacterium]
MKPLFQRIRFQLITLCLLGALPVVALLVLAALRERAQMMENARERALQLSHALARINVESLLDHSNQVLCSLADNPSVLAGVTGPGNRFLEGVRAQDPAFRNICLMSPEGAVTTSARPVPESERLQMLAGVRRAVATREPGVGEFRLLPGEDAARADLHHPVPGPGGRVTGVVSLTVSLGFLESVMDRMKLPEGTSVAVVRGDGALLARFPNQGRWAGGEAPAAIVAALRAAPDEGTLEARGVDGIPRLFAFCGLEPRSGQRSYLFVGIPRTTALAPARRRFGGDLIAILGVLALSLLAASAASGPLVLNRIRRLLHVTRRLSRGDLSVRTGSAGGTGELDQLARAFDDMAAALQARQLESESAREELRARTATLEILVKAAPVSLQAVDLEGRVRLWNPASERIFGWKAEEVLGRPLPTLPPAARALFERRCRRAIECGAPLEEWEGELLRKGGTTIRAHAWHTGLRNSKGETDALLGIVADVSETHRLEQELLQSQKLEAVARLAGGVAHDFNNFVAVVLGYSQLVEDQLEEPSPLRKDVTEIRRAAERAGALTRQLLLFSRRQAPEPRAMDLGESLAGVEKLLRRLIGEDIRLVCERAESVGTVLADPGQMEQLLMNLAVNARDAMPHGGTLKISLARGELDADAVRGMGALSPGPHVVLDVADTGCGMAPETLQHIYEPFFTTKDGAHGTGLGLATVYGIVKQSGGHIEVLSELGVGTRFRLYFPVVEAVSLADKPTPASADGGGGSETILLAEDDGPVRQVAARVLAERGYRVLQAATGAHALDLASAHPGPIHLLLADVVMPGMGGPELARRIASSRPGTRVLLLSGHVGKSATSPEIRGHAFLAKPFTPDALAREVRRVLASTPRTSRSGPLAA